MKFIKLVIVILLVVAAYFVGKLGFSESWQNVVDLYNKIVNYFSSSTGLI